MKRYFSLLIAITLSAAVHTRVLTLNNNNPSPGQYTTWSSAYTAALAGDTILVQQSSSAYGNITVSASNKSITVIGAGHYAAGALTGRESRFDNIDVNSVGNAKIKFYGIYFTISYADISQPNTVFENCCFANAGSTSYYFRVSTNNILIRGCIFRKLRLETNNSNNVSNLLVVNSYFETTDDGYCISSMNGTGTKLFTSNIFSSVGGTTWQLISGGNSFRNTVFSNNIFYGVTPRGGQTHTDLLFSNNLVYGSADDAVPAGSAGSGNLLGVDPLFANVPHPADRPPFDYKYDYHLQAGSPARGTGSGGLDMGLYPSTGREFSMTGEPERPFTMRVTPANAVVPAGGATSVSVAIRQGSVPVAPFSNPNPVCRAKVSPTEYKNFMCYNLGAASTSLDPFIPRSELIGGYWQWGRLDQAAEGPSGGDPRSGSISGWNTIAASNGAWSDASKTASDPCPAGFRMPTKAQWDGVFANNTVTRTGTWGISPTNYYTGIYLGAELFLPAAGYRFYSNGALYSRGGNGYYWSSTEFGNGGSWYLSFSSSDAGTDYNYRTDGLSVRCVAE